MSTEMDLSAELAAVKAQLKEQTHQMAEMASMMKSMMSLAVPLLEEKASKLRKEKEEEVRKLRKEKEEEVRKQYKQVMDDLKGCMGGKQMRLYTARMACCSVPFCNYMISAGNGGVHDEVICPYGHRYSLSNQRFRSDKEKLILEKFLRMHREIALYRQEKENIPDSKLSPEQKAYHDKEAARELAAKKFMGSK